MQIKVFSKKVGVSMDTIRYYEKIGLLHPKRRNNGYRDYDEDCLAQLKMIVVLKHIGFSLQEITQLVTLKEREITLECNDIAISLFDKKIDELTKKIEFFKSAKETLIKSKNLMNGKHEYEKNQMEIERSIDRLFHQLKGD